MKEEFKMRVDMLEMSEDNVKAWLGENMLVSKAEKVSNEEINGGRRGRQRRNSKSFDKYGTTTALPEKVEFEKIKTPVKDNSEVTKIFYL
ncbi:hypothetical protein V6N13_037711 [Hibiscus sabdariffa]